MCTNLRFVNEKEVAIRFGVILKEARDRKNLTQGQVAALTGIDATRVSRYESGGMPRLLLFVALCEAVGLKPEKVLRQIVTP